MTLIRNIAFSSIICFSLTACKDTKTQSAKTSFDKTFNTSAGIFRTDDIPHAQLSGNVIPQAYRINIRMDPDANQFNGEVEIDVDIEKPTDKIWLHGKEMNVNSAVAITTIKP